MLEGTAQDNATSLSPAVAWKAVGAVAEDADCGVAVAVASELYPLPLYARTLNVYAVPFVNPVYV